MALGMKAHIGVDAKSGLTTAQSPPRPTSMTSISWVICWERSNLSQPMPATAKAPQREGAGRGGWDWLIAERPGKVNP